MKQIILFLATSILFLSGCAVLDTTLDVLDILLPDDPQVIEAPEPICNKSTVGLNHNGRTCLEYTDGSYLYTLSD